MSYAIVECNSDLHHHSLSWSLVPIWFLLRNIRTKVLLKTKPQDRLTLQQIFNFTRQNTRHAIMSQVLFILFRMFVTITITPNLKQKFRILAFLQNWRLQSHWQLYIFPKIKLVPKPQSSYTYLFYIFYQMVSVS